MFGITAAHRTLPLGTLLHVTDLKTGRGVQVKVNDRGPFVGDRMLDLSYGAARVFGIIQDGTAEVEIEIIGRGAMLSSSRNEPSRFVVQVGSYQEKENAVKMKERIGHYYRTVYLETIESNTRIFHRVRIGPFHSDAEAQSVAGRLSSQISEEEVHPIVVRGD